MLLKNNNLDNTMNLNNTMNLPLFFGKLAFSSTFYHNYWFNGLLQAFRSCKYLKLLILTMLGSHFSMIREKWWCSGQIAFGFKGVLNAQYIYK